MNIQIPTAAAQPVQLPQLIKQSPTYKLFVPKKVEEKIRYLCRKFPSLEWSGVLFTRHTGNFEDGSLEIHCEDIYPMDLGSAGFTEFKMDETVAGYIAENIDLFDCDCNLIHSHNNMNCWFSGTDISTLQSEGDDKNCFVSLIVNNAGTYCAAVTRKIQRKTEVITKSLGTSYEFFGEGPIKTGEDPMSESTQIIDKEVIEYFMLGIQVEPADNPLDYLDTRFEEIEAKKKEQKAAWTPTFPAPYKDTYISKTKDSEFFNWLHSDSEAKKERAEEPTLFDNQTMDELIDPDKWEPDPTVIEFMVAQMITCSLIISDKTDLKQWITRHMVRKYEEIFEDFEEFSRWADASVEFFVYHYNESDVPDVLCDDWDLYVSKIAKAFVETIEEYPKNEYLDYYVELLNKRIYG